MSPSGEASVSSAPLRVAALFWFYKDFGACRERLALLRALNPTLSVFGLYGGPPERAAEASAELGGALDDLYLFDEPRDATWRWIQGDRVIAAWYANRGRRLRWDTLAIVQWDILLAAPLAELTAALRPGEAAFSGDRPLAEVASWWGWGGGGSAMQTQVLEEFRRFLRTRFGYHGPLWCCLFIFAALPREFLDRYLAEGPPEPGFLEHKLPTLARVFGVPVRRLPAFDVWWRADPQTLQARPAERALSAVAAPVAPELIASELARPNGRRAFHPVYEVGPRLADAIRAAAPPGSGR